MNSRQKLLTCGLLFCVLLLVITVNVRMRAPAKGPSAAPVEEAAAIPSPGTKSAVGDDKLGEEKTGEPKETAPTKELAGVDSANSQGPFVVLIDSFPSKDKAVERANGLKEGGFGSAFLAETTVSEGGTLHTWYRVYLGHYPDARTATADAEKLRKKRDIASYIVRKLEE